MPPQVKHLLTDISESLKGQVEGARWIAPENIHLTLKFLGSTPDEKLDDITSAIESAVKGFRKFYFSLDSMGGFPNTKKARVLWVGVQHGSDELIELSKSIDKALAPLGFEAEKKPFKPHITLARIKTPRSIAEALSQLPPDIFEGRVVNVDGITVFQSHLKRSGAEYETLRFIPLPG